MEPGLWQRVEELVQRALELDESRRAEFLGSSCRGDEALRWEAESLVTQENRFNHFLKRMTSSSVAAKANGIACKPAGRGPPGSAAFVR